MSDPGSSSAASGTLRQTASPWTLMRAAVGGPRQIAGKLGRVGRTLHLWLSPSAIDARLAELERKGFIRE